MRASVPGAWDMPASHCVDAGDGDPLLEVGSGALAQQWPDDLAERGAYVVNC